MLAIKAITIAGIVSAILVHLYWLIVIGRKRESLIKSDDRIRFVRGLFGVSSVVISILLIFTDCSTSGNLFIRYIGYLLVCGGVAFRVWSQITLGRNWSISVEIQDNHRLITNGPYKLVRHPMYTSYFLFTFGSFSLAPNPYLLLTWTIFLVLVIARAKEEDKLLFSVFDSNFADYRERVGMFFPKIFKH